MPVLPPTMLRLIEALAKLPGLGPKSSQRIVLALLRQPKSAAEELAGLLEKLHEATVHCKTCYMATEQSDDGRCAICRDPRREANMLCVVASSVDIAQIEDTHEYRGRYHVLGGTLSPLEGVTPETLTVAALLKRVKTSNPPISEVILAFDQNVEGETTVLYLKNALKEGASYNGSSRLGSNNNQYSSSERSQVPDGTWRSESRSTDIKVSRLARGLPTNSELEYADPVTLANAMKERKAI